MPQQQQPHLGNEDSCYHPIRSMRAMTDAGIDPKTAEIVAEQIADAHNKGRREFLGAIEKVFQRFDEKIDKAFAETNKRIEKLDEKIDKALAETNKRIEKLEEKIDKSIAETNKKFDDLQKEMRAMSSRFTTTMVTLFGVMIAAFGIFAYIFHS